MGSLRAIAQGYLAGQSPPWDPGANSEDAFHEKDLRDEAEEWAVKARATGSANRSRNDWVMLGAFKKTFERDIGDTLLALASEAGGAETSQKFFVSFGYNKYGGTAVHSPSGLDLDIKIPTFPVATGSCSVSSGQLPSLDSTTVGEFFDTIALPPDLPGIKIQRSGHTISISLTVPLPDVASVA